MQIDDRIKLRIYIHALRAMKDVSKDGGVLGLCRALDMAASTEKLNGRLYFGYADHLYPEILRHRPTENYCAFYWFDPFDRTPRIQVLEKAIIEVKARML